MFKKETEYALRAMVYIWQQNDIKRRPGIIETSEEIDAPTAFTGKILQRLVKGGLILSQRGKGGGFYFDPDGDDVLLKEVIALIEGQKIFTSCGFGLGQCSDEDPCPIHDQFIHVRSALDNLFSGNTIRDLATKDQKLSS